MELAFERKPSKLDEIRKLTLQEHLRLNEILALTAFFAEYNQMKIGDNHQIITDLTLRRLDPYYRQAYHDHPVSSYLLSANIPNISADYNGSIYYHKVEKLTEKQKLMITAKLSPKLRKLVIAA